MTWNINNTETPGFPSPEAARRWANDNLPDGFHVSITEDNHGGYPRCHRAIWGVNGYAPRFRAFERCVGHHITRRDGK